MTRSDRWTALAPRVLYLGSAPTLGDGAIGDGLLRRLLRAWPGRALRILTSTPRFYASLPSAAGAEVAAKLDLQVRAAAELPLGLDRHVRTLARLAALDRGRPAWGPGALPEEVLRRWPETYGWADVVIHQGGPQWNDNWLPAGTLRFHALRLAAARARGRPVALLGQGCGPFRWQGGWRAALRRRWAARSLSRTTAVVTRDDASAAALDRLGLRRTAVLAAGDPALLVPAEESRRSRALTDFLSRLQRPPLAVSVRPLRAEYGALMSHEAAFHRRMAAFLDAAGERYSPVLLSTGGDEDRRTLAAIEEHRQGPPVAVPGGPDHPGLEVDGLTPAELVTAYGACRLLVSVRLHPAILAAGAGVPSLLVPYDPKGNHFARQAGLDRFTLPLERFTAEAARDRLDELEHRRDAVVADLEERLAVLRRRTAGALDETFDLLRGSDVERPA